MLNGESKKLPKLILASIGVVWDDKNSIPHDGINDLIVALNKLPIQFVVISNQPKPSWFANHFEGVEFWYQPGGRQKVSYLKDLLKTNEDRGLKYSDIVILGVKDDDFYMAVNSKLVFVHCEWNSTLQDRLKKYGVPCDNPKRLLNYFALLDDKNPWFFRATDSSYELIALSSAGTKAECDEELVRFNDLIKDCLKSGNTKILNEVKLFFLTCVCAVETCRDADLWTYYPSSNSSNEKKEVMAKFSDLARTTMKCKEAKDPLFIRHANTSARHKLSSTKRKDPESELISIHLNPIYEQKINGKVVVVVDDYTTYGVTIGVAASLLKAAGAKKVIGVTIGKFGNVGQQYEIDCSKYNVFAPISKNPWKIKISSMYGEIKNEAKNDFKEKFGRAL